MDQQKLRVNDLFRRFDGNHDGMLTREEFMKALKASGESEIIGAFSFIIIISFLNERIVNTPQTPSSRLGDLIYQCLGSQHPPITFSFL